MVGIFTGLDKKPKKKEIVLTWFICVIFAFIIFTFIAVVGLDVDISLIMLFWFIVIITSALIGYRLYG